MTLGIAHNQYAPNAPTQIAAAARRLDIPVRAIDMSSLSMMIGDDGAVTVADQAGVIGITALAPYLLFGFPAAAHSLRALCRTAYTQNPVDGVLIADDKAATAEQLAAAGVPQVTTRVCAMDAEQARSAAERIGYPVVLKRTHGAQGRWVRRAFDHASLALAVAELQAEGPSALVVQREVAEYRGRSVRAVVTGGRLLIATERLAAQDDWRSNISAGGAQRNIDLAPEEAMLAHRAAETLRLGHAGIDIMRTSQGPAVLEVNACPDFTSMQPYARDDLAQAVVAASVSTQGGSDSGGR